VVDALENISPSMEMKLVMTVNPMIAVLNPLAPQFNVTMVPLEDALESAEELLKVLASGYTESALLLARE